jgi:hypothetical protein
MSVILGVIAGAVPYSRDSFFHPERRGLIDPRMPPPPAYTCLCPAGEPPEYPPTTTAQSSVDVNLPTNPPANGQPSIVQPPRPSASDPSSSPGDGVSNYILIGKGITIQPNQYTSYLQGSVQQAYYLPLPALTRSLTKITFGASWSQPESRKVMVSGSRFGI